MYVCVREREREGGREIVCVCVKKRKEGRTEGRKERSDMMGCERAERRYTITTLPSGIVASQQAHTPPISLDTVHSPQQSYRI